MNEQILYYIDNLELYKKCGEESSDRFWATIELVKKMLEYGITLKHWSERNGIRYDFDYAVLKQMLTEAVGKKADDDYIHFR